MQKRLRIAFFVHEFPALSETFVLNQVTGLLEMGHDVRIFATRPRAEPIIHEDVERFTLGARTRYLKMPGNRSARLLTAIGRFARHGWQNSGLFLRSLNIRRYGTEATSLRLLFWADALRDEAPFDIIQCHFGPLGQLAAKLRDIGAISGRLTTVFHGVDISAYVRNQPDYYRFLFGNGDLFLPISRAWSRKLVELGCDPAHIDVHHMGIDVARYPFRARRYVPGQPLRLLTVGRMVEKKGITYGLRAVAELARRGIAVRYLIVGDGPLRAELETLVWGLGIASSVYFCGWRDQTAVAALMETSDILLAPSVTSAEGDQEGIPVTLMEAMASGMLVISTYHSGIPELVDHGRSGILVPERDVEGLVNGLMRLVRTGEGWTEMSEAARRRVQGEFEITALNARLVERWKAPPTTQTIADHIAPESAIARARIAMN